VLPIWVYEPAMWQQGDMAAQHLDFANDCLAELGRGLAQDGDMLAVLSSLRDRLGPFVLVSHEETGNGWSYARDQAVAGWCQAQGIEWREFPSNGMVRRLVSHDGGRNRWSRHWNDRMLAPRIAAPQGVQWLPLHRLQGLPVCGALAARPGAAACAEGMDRKPGGRSAGRPERLRVPAGRDGQARATVLALPADQRPAGFLGSLISFESRLHWHCHFIQKLESEPQIEFRNVNHGFDGRATRRC